MNSVRSNHVEAAAMKSFSRLIHLTAVCLVVVLTLADCARPVRRPPPRRPYRTYYGVRHVEHRRVRPEPVEHRAAAARGRAEPDHGGRAVAGERRAAPSRPSSPSRPRHTPVTGVSHRDETPSRTMLDGDETVSPSGDRVYREKQTGRIVGSASTSPSGNTTYRDAGGRITGSSGESPGGRTTHRDSRGKITHTSDTSSGTSGDSTTTYRRNGAIVGQKYVSPAGNVTWRDGKGRIISGPDGMKQ